MFRTREEENFPASIAEMENPNGLADAIKIDASFVRDFRKDVDDAMIVDDTLSLAHNPGLVVVFLFLFAFSPAWCR